MPSKSKIMAQSLSTGWNLAKKKKKSQLNNEPTNSSVF